MSKARNNANTGGKLVQMTNIRVDGQYGYTVSNSPSVMTELNQTITPIYATSKVIVQWEIHYEADYNSVFVIYKNGSVMSNGYNTSTGNVFYSGYAATSYDVDIASTPNRTTITFVDTVGSTSATTYGLGLKSAQGSNTTLYLNRPYSSTGANSYEIGVSMGTIMEIAQ